MDLSPGTRLGPFEIVEFVGRGGMGSVYKGYDPTLHRHVALKVLHHEFLLDASFGVRFRREAQIWARLDHPSVVPVYFADIEEEHPFLAMKFVAGGSLSERLRKGPLPLDQAVTILADIAGALDYAHSLGIVHRDVKPANVLLGDDGRAYLSDFGIARVLAPTGVATHSGVVGTPVYMAPEQARSQQPDPRSDLYSLGCMAYEMVTGSQPFRGETPVDVMMRHITDEPTPPRALTPDLSAHADGAILKAMAKDPSERWPSASLFVQALLGRVHMDGVQTVSIHGHPPLRAPAPETRPARPRSARARRALRLLAAAALGGVLGIAVVAWLRQRSTPPDITQSQGSESVAILLAAAHRAMDEGRYPEAFQIGELAARLYPGHPRAQALSDQVRRAWDAEKSVGVWTETPSPLPSPGPS